MSDVIVSSLVPAEAMDGPGFSLKRLAFVSAAFGFGVIFLVYVMLVFSLFGAVRSGMIIGLAASFGFAALGVWAWFTKSIVSPANLFLLVLVAASTLVATKNGGADGYAAPLLIVVPAAAACFLGQRATIWWGVVAVLCVIGLQVADSHGLVVDSPFGDAEVSLAATLLVIGAICLVLIASATLTYQTGAHANQIEHGRALLTRMAEVAQVGGWELDLATMRPVWTDQMRAVHEVASDFRPTFEEAIGFYAPKARQKIEDALNDCIRSGTSFDIELPLTTALSREIWVRVAGHRVCKNGVPAKVIGAIQDVTQQKEERESLARALEKADQALSDLRAYQSALDQKAIVAMTDARGKITFVNDKFCEVSGYAREELLGQNHRILNSSHHPKEFFVDMWRTIARGEPWNAEVCNRAKDGQLYWVDTVIIPICDLSGRPQQYVSIRHDITDRVIYAEELESRRQEAETANELKSQFLANMSHEIRTPLNGVLGMLQLLERTSLDETQQRYARTIRSSSNALLAVINDVLDVSKIEAGLMQVNDAVFDLDELLAQVRDSVVGIAVQKGLALSVKRAFEGPAAMIGDSKCIQQVLTNLAGNAVKFTDHGFVDISVQRESRGSFRFVVTDSGSGIPLDQQKTIFERFVQADGSATRRHGGTGLGLAISKELIGLMGGEIGVDSNEGSGASFWFTLPLAEDGIELAPPAKDQTQPLAEDPASEGGALDQAEIKILIAEDNPVNREVITTALDVWEGLEIVAVENGAEAIEQLDLQPFDLVLMDIHMPVMNGMDAIKHIRASNASYWDIPIIVTTANTLSSQTDTYLQAGASACVAKPIVFKELVETIVKHLPAKENTAKVA